MTLRRKVSQVEKRLDRIEQFCHKVEDVLLLSMEFNPFEQCCKDDVDRLILKLLVEHGKATTSQLAKWIETPLRKNGKKPITRFAVFHRLKKLRQKAVEQEREELLIFHPEKSGKIFRYWAVEPLLIDKLREQASKLEIMSKKL